MLDNAPENRPPQNEGAGETTEPQAIAHGPAIDPHKQFHAQMMDYLENSLQEHYPELFSGTAQVESLASGGLTATVFRAVGDNGKEYFLKVRPLATAEVLEELNTTSDFAKEAEMTKTLREHAIPVTMVHPPSSFVVADFAPGLAELELNYIGIDGKAGDRPFVLMAQEFVDGQPLVTLLHDTELANTAYENYGQALGQMNEIPASGYGAKYDSTSKSFSFTFEEFINRHNIEDKLDELIDANILSPDQSDTIQELVNGVGQSELPSVYAHFDPNPGNVLVDPDTGSVKALIDFDSSGASPWQYALVKAMNSIEASSFLTTQTERSDRVRALLSGYGKSRDELSENKELIDAFRVIDAVNFIHTMFVKYELEYKPEAYQSIGNDSYNWMKGQNDPCFEYTAYSFEAILKRTLLDYQQSDG